jgi:hypothetical protein
MQQQKKKDREAGKKAQGPSLGLHIIGPLGSAVSFTIFTAA